MLRERVPLLVMIVIFLSGIIAGMILNSPAELPAYSYADDHNFYPTNLENSPIPDKSFSRIAREVTRSVVTINTEKDTEIGGGFERLFRQFRRQRPETGLGSGIIIDPQGYILTNYHVVRDVESIKILLPDRRSYPAKLVGVDPTTDLCSATGRPTSQISSDPQHVEVIEGLRIMPGHRRHLSRYFLLHGRCQTTQPRYIFHQAT